MLNYTKNILLSLLAFTFLVSSAMANPIQSSNANLEKYSSIMYSFINNEILNLKEFKKVDNIGKKNEIIIKLLSGEIKSYKENIKVYEHIQSYKESLLDLKDAKMELYHSLAKENIFKNKMLNFIKNKPEINSFIGKKKDTFLKMAFIMYQDYYYNLTLSASGLTPVEDIDVVLCSLYQELSLLINDIDYKYVVKEKEDKSTMWYFSNKDIAKVFHEIQHDLNIASVYKLKLINGVEKSIDKKQKKSELILEANKEHLKNSI